MFLKNFILIFIKFADNIFYLSLWEKFAIFMTSTLSHIFIDWFYQGLTFVKINFPVLINIKIIIETISQLLEFCIICQQFLNFLESLLSVVFCHFQIKSFYLSNFIYYYYYFFFLCEILIIFIHLLFYHKIKTRINFISIENQKLIFLIIITIIMRVLFSLGKTIFLIGIFANAYFIIVDTYMNETFNNQMQILFHQLI